MTSSRLNAFAMQSAVMSSCVGTDSAGGEDVVELGPQRSHRVDDHAFDVGNDSRFAHAYPPFIQLNRDVAQVRVLRATGQDFVADDQHASGDDRIVHGRVQCGCDARSDRSTTSWRFGKVVIEVEQRRMSR